MNTSFARHFNPLRRQTICLMAAAMLVGAAARATAGAADAVPLPSDSIYQLNAQLTNQDGQSFTLEQLRGHSVLVGLFYTSCEFVCPMLVDALRNTEAKLSAQEREHVSVLLVTIDPARDTVAVLKRTAQQRALDVNHWTLARTDAASTRKLAAVLGMQYRALPNGDFNHSSNLILLDANGRVAARTAQLGSVDPAFVKQIKLAVK